VAVDRTMTMHLNLGEGEWVEVSDEEDDNDDLAFLLGAQILLEGTVIVPYEIQVSGYVSVSGRFVCHNKMMNETARDVPMSPPVIMPTRAARVGTVETLRVVLKWGEHPRDLDLHCATSKPVPITEDGRTSNHMYHALAQTNSDITGEMRLDKDDTSGCGHETLTLDKLRTDVAYWFGVHHYSGEGSLATSEATIEIYLWADECTAPQGRLRTRQRHAIQDRCAAYRGRRVRQERDLELLWAHAKWDWWLRSNHGQSTHCN
jgi:hypothetical protein